MSMTPTLAPSSWPVPPCRAPLAAVADDIYDGNDGGEMWTNNSGSLISATTGKSVGSLPSSDNFVIWWDADEARELEDQTSITKYGGATPLLTCIDCASNNSTKATPALSADLLGDWREEIIWREKDNSALRLYTTTDVTTRRIYTLMHDPQYRMQVSSEQAGFNQPPHPSSTSATICSCLPSPTSSCGGRVRSGTMALIVLAGRLSGR